MTQLSVPAGGRQGAPALSGFNLLAIILIVCIAGLSLAYGIDALVDDQPDRPDPSSFGGPLVRINVAGQSLTIPEAWFVDPAQAAGGFSDLVGLNLFVPFQAGADPARVGVRLMPHSRAQSSAYLLDKVYLHQFTNDQVEGAPGLIGKPLRGEDGFAGETVWYDPLSPMPFVAKCEAPVGVGDAPRCIRTVRLSEGLSVTYSFDREILADWPRFDGIMRPWLEQIGAISALSLTSTGSPSIPATN